MGSTPIVRTSITERVTPGLSTCRFRGRILSPGGTRPRCATGLGIAVLWVRQPPKIGIVAPQRSLFQAGISQEEFAMRIAALALLGSLGLAVSAVSASAAPAVPSLDTAGVEYRRGRRRLRPVGSPQSLGALRSQRIRPLVAVERLLLRRRISRRRILRRRISAPALSLLVRILTADPAA